MPVPDYETEYLAAFGNMVVKYNIAEANLRGFLTGIIRLELTTTTTIIVGQILTVELGAINLVQAIKSYADFIKPKALREAVFHATEYMDRIREYRNFYVHGIDNILLTDTGPKGWIKVFSSKSTLKEHKAIVNLEDLNNIAEHCVTFSTYINNVGNCLTYRADRSPADWPIPRLSHKPTLPKKLSKPHRNWIEYFLPRPAC